MLQLALAAAEIAVNTHYSHSTLTQALWRGSRSVSAIQSSIPRKHWNLVWVWHSFQRSVHQEKP